MNETFPLTSTARVCPAELERTWKSRVSAGADWPPSLDVPPLYTIMGFPPNRLIKWAGSFPCITLTWYTNTEFKSLHLMKLLSQQFISKNTSCILMLQVVLPNHCRHILPNCVLWNMHQQGVEKKAAAVPTTDARWQHRAKSCHTLRWEWDLWY